MLPGTLLYVYVGSLAGNLAAAAAGPEVSGGTDGPLEMIVRIAGFTATLLVTILVARIARRALSTRIEE
jgi:uncharacterized membrane protein YdjX (TVP38/TMEM64 family)